MRITLKTIGGLTKPFIPPYKKKNPTNFLIEFLAEREGFEPPVPLSTSVFKTDAIDHSAISPKLLFEVLQLSDF